MLLWFTIECRSMTVHDSFFSSQSSHHDTDSGGIPLAMTNPRHFSSLLYFFSATCQPRCKNSAHLTLRALPQNATCHDTPKFPMWISCTPYPARHTPKGQFSQAALLLGFTIQCRSMTVHDSFFSSYSSPHDIDSFNCGGGVIPLAIDESRLVITLIQGNGSFHCPRRIPGGSFHQP